MEPQRRHSLAAPAATGPAIASQTSCAVLDLATGGGDLPIRLWFKGQRARLNLDLAGCDISPVAIEHARQRAARAGIPLDQSPGVSFFVHDVLRGELLQEYDAVMASLFLHHQESDETARALLRRMGQLATRLVLVNDLVRGRLHLWLARVACRLLVSSFVVHTDGPRSVRGRLHHGRGTPTGRGGWPDRGQRGLAVAVPFSAHLETSHVIDSGSPSSLPRSRLALLGMGTAVPEAAIDQKDGMEIARILCARTPEQETWLPTMYQGTGIEKRHLSLGKRRGPRCPRRHPLLRLALPPPGYR